MAYKRPRNNVMMVKLKQQKRATLSSGRTFVTRYAKRTKTNLPANVTIKRRGKGKRDRRRAQRREGLGSLNRRHFDFLKRFAKSDVGVSLGRKALPQM